MVNSLSLLRRQRKPLDLRTAEHAVASAELQEPVHLAAMKVPRLPRAAVHASGPEVVGEEWSARGRYGRHAVGVDILEGDRLGLVDVGANLEG